MTIDSKSPMNWYRTCALYLGISSEAFNPKVYRCSLDVSNAAARVYVRKQVLSHTSYCPSYVWNQEAGYIHNNLTDWWTRACNMARVKYPTKFITTCHMVPGGDTTYSTFNWLNASRRADTLGTDAHNGKGIYLHSDGHVSNLHIPYASRIAGDASYNIWFFPNGKGQEDGPIR